MRILLFNERKFVTSVSAYAYTITNLTDVKDTSYENLNRHHKCFQLENLIIFGEFITRTYCSIRSWDRLIRNNEVGRHKTYNLQLSDADVEHSFLVTNT